jgi:NAD-dependent SIR2 family protein deacetylase
MTQKSELSSAVQSAVAAIQSADGLVIGAGAGMGVDSGMPDFRGTQGFWRAYPPYAKLGLDFPSLANPRWFRDDPALAWGFYGHRRNLYRSTVPHAGFQLLRRWAGRMKHGSFVFTSNVDGHFQKAGFDADRVLECHGSIDFLQCTASCGIGIFPADCSEISIDLETMRAALPLPRCPSCEALARPNILMFGDWEWDGSRTEEQQRRLQAWLDALTGSLVIVECGAGMAIPTVRRFCQRLAEQAGGRLIRINLHEPSVPAGHIGLPLGALEALRAIDAAWRASAAE